MKFLVMDKTGHTEVDFKEDFELADSFFQKAQIDGKMGYAKTECGNVFITDLNEVIELNAEIVVLIPPVVGG